MYFVNLMVNEISMDEKIICLKNGFKSYYLVSNVTVALVLHNINTMMGERGELTTIQSVSGRIPNPKLPKL